MQNTTDTYLSPNQIPLILHAGILFESSFARRWQDTFWGFCTQKIIIPITHRQMMRIMHSVRCVQYQHDSIEIENVEKNMLKILRGKYIYGI